MLGVAAGSNVSPEDGPVQEELPRVDRTRRKRYGPYVCAAALRFASAGAFSHVG